MKANRVNGSEMRSVLAGMVVDRTVCSRIASQWPNNGGGLFDVPWANLVGGWCVEHLRKFGDVPNGQLRTLYNEWAATTKAPEETVRGVERFLQLADEERSKADRVNSDFVLDRANRYFNSVRMKEALSNAEELLEIGKVDEAQGVLLGLSRVELASTSTVRVVSDWDAWRKAFDEDRERPLVSYPGELQEFLGRWMQRDALIGFMAPDKTGKSVFLLDLAVRAVRNRCRVMYFDTGDNSQDQVMRRLGSRVARHPGRENFEPSVDVPVSLVKGEEGKYEVETKLKKFKRAVTVSAAYRAMGKISRGKDRMRVVCYPNGTASVADLSSKLCDMEQEDGWSPDVVVVDYADILAAPPGVKDTLDQIDETWKQLRRLSQERHCLVVTATQASAAAYNDKATVLRKQHFSGRKTKLAHVNGMIGINVSNEDRQMGITRLNWIVRREGRYQETDQMVVAGCWAWYNPVIKVASTTAAKVSDQDE